MAKQVNSIYWFTFLFRLLLLWSINDTIKYYTNYFNTKRKRQMPGFTINCFFFNVHVIDDGTIQKKVLMSNPTITGFNEIFNVSHGLKNTVNNFNDTDLLWRIIHDSVRAAQTSCMKSTISGKTLIDNMIDDFNNAIYEKLGESIVYTEFIEEVSLNWFGKFMAGDAENFKSLRNDVLDILQFTFYNNPFRKVPIIGVYVSRLLRYFVQNKINIIRDKFKRLIPKLHQYKNCFWYELRENIHSKLSEDFYDKTSDNFVEYYDDIFIDNAFISVLEYDFINMVLQGMLIERITKDKIEKDDINAIIKENFLFPYRGRRMTCDLKTNNNDMCDINTNDICLLNLTSDNSTNMFSYGPRTCPGQILVKPLLTEFRKRINSLEFITLDNNIKKMEDLDTPIITKGPIGFIRDPNILISREDLLSGNSDFIPPLRNIWDIYTNEKLLSDVMTYFNHNVNPYCNFDIIVAPEARSLPLAGIISSDSAVRSHSGFLILTPIIVMTKTDKFGKTMSETYTRGYSGEKTTIHLYESFCSSVKDKQVLFVDDGLASGGTTCACLDLIKHAGGIVSCIFVMTKHNYCELDQEYREKYNDITYCCYQL